ncbi:hypothetical protein [Acetobacter okinawensis]
MAIGAGAGVSSQQAGAYAGTQIMAMLAQLAGNTTGDKHDER